MFILGILSIIQIIFLPGLIFQRLYRVQGGFFFRLSSVFAISLICNFLIVFFLTRLHIYTRPVLLVLVIFEVISLIWLYRPVFKISMDQLADMLSIKLNSFFTELKLFFLPRQFTPAMLLIRQIFQAALFGLAISLMLWFIRGMLYNFGTVFNTWDAVVAWNKSAQLWSTNQIPEQIGMYPQLLPANLSLTYLLLGNTEVVLFAKAIMTFFSTLIIITLFELAIEQKKIGYLIAVIISYLMLKKFTGDILMDGYADIPVAFMVFMTLVQIFKHPDLALDKKELVLGGIFAAGAALTKQVGIYCLAVYPVIAFFSTTKYSKEKLKNVLLCFGIALLITIPWFFPKAVLVLNDFANSNLFALADVAASSYNNVPLYQRIILSFESLGKYLILYLASIPFLFLVEKRFRLLIVLFLIPFSILWGIVASYDQRNLAITFPLLAVVIGLGVEKLMDILLSFLPRLKIGKITVFWLVVFCIIAFVGISFLVTNQDILLLQREKQKQIFSPEINEQIYALPINQSDCAKILTNYPVAYLPGLENNQVNSYFNDPAVYYYLIEDPSTCWMLVPNYAEDAIKQDIQTKIESGAYTLLFEFNKWVPYRLIQIK